MAPDDTQPAGRKPPAVLLKVLNPLALAIAGQRWFPLWARVKHRGRRSGTEYTIPVAIVAVTADRFVIGLPWGPNTNWAKNVVAAGGCTLTWRGHDETVTEPRVIDTVAARDLASGFRRRIVGRGGFPAFLQLSRPAPAQGG